MAIGLPPAQTPQMGDLAVLRNEAGGGLSFDYDLYHVHVSGNDEISDATLKKHFLAADNVSDGVRSIASLYYRAGYVLTNVVYAVSGRDLYVHIAVKGVGKVKAPDTLMPYLAGLANDGPLTDSKLEPRRLLANIAAQRADIKGSNLRIVNGGDEGQPAYALVASGYDGSWGTIHGSLDYGNIGNRYVGRDIADAAVTVTSKYGDKLSVAGVTSVRAFGIGDPGGFYREVNAAYDRDTPWGVFGVNGRYAPFRQTVHGLFSVSPGTTGTTGSGGSTTGSSGGLLGSISDILSGLLGGTGSTGGLLGGSGSTGAQPTTVTSLQFRGRIKQVGVSWLGPIYADFSKRLILQLRGLRSSFSEELVGYGNPKLDSELYTAVEGSLNYQQTLGSSGHWRLGGALSLSKGLGSHHPSGTTANLGYLLYRPSVSLTYTPSVDWTAALSVDGQYSDDTVPQTQQWLLGGLDHIAAYRSGVAIGDTGGLARLVIARNDIPFWLLAFTPSVFVEYGASRRMHSLAGQPPQRTQSLADAGGSLRITFGKHLAATASMAQHFYSSHLDPAVRESFGATYFFRVTASF